jgi:DNA-binding CsgD family transcriptional regulator
VKKNKYILIIVFGISMAVLTLILQLVQYRFLIGSLDRDVYTTVIATLFTAVGIWVGYNLIKPKKPKEIPPGEIDQEMLESLKLNDREYEVLNLIAQGHTNKQIADQLFLALPTIKTHTSNLYSKLDVNNRTQAVHKARVIRII